MIWGIVRRLIESDEKATEDVVKNVSSSYFGRKLSGRIRFYIFIPFVLINVLLIFSVPFYLYHYRIAWVYGFLLLFVLFVFSAFSLDFYKRIFDKCQKETEREISDYSKLKAVRDEKGMLSFFDSVFKQSDEKLEREYGIKGLALMGSFLDVVSQDIEESSVNTIDYYRKVTNIFLSNTKGRNRISLFIITDIIDKILSVHFKVWSLAYSECTSDNFSLEKWSALDNLSETFSTLITELVYVSLQSGDIYSYMHKLGDHFRKNENSKFERGRKEYWYLEQFSFERILFKNINKLSRRGLSVVIPEDWLLTIKNVSDRKDSKLKVIDFIIHEYLYWADKILYHNSKDKELFEEFNEEWIPDVSLKAWSYIVTYKRRSWSDGNRIKSLIENPPDFNQRERISIHSSEVKNDKDRVLVGKLKKTIRLAQHIRVLRFTKEEAIKALEEISEISPENEKQEEVTKDLKILFEGVLRTLEQNE
jgi:hypothetical protein